MPPTLTEAFPPLPLAELRDLIEGFDASSLEQKKAAIERLVAHHVLLNFEWGQDWRYRRVQKLGPGDQVTNIDHVIWRKDQPAAPGRANPANFGVLYMADRPNTAFVEARIGDDQVAIAEFQVQPGKSVRLYPIGELCQIQRTGTGFLLGAESSKINDLINACQPWDVARAMLITDAFLLKLVTAQDDYEVSAHVVMSIFNKIPELTVVSYSSRLLPGAINFATRIERFWEDWGIASIRCGRAQHLAMGYYCFGDIKRVEGIGSDGALNWSDVSYPENNALLFKPPWTPGSTRGTAAA